LPRPRAARLHGDLLHRAALAAADDGDDQPAVRLHRDADVDALEQHDLVSLEPGVELREPAERRGRGVNRERHEEREVDPAEVAFLDEGDGRDLAVGARHLFDDRTADAADGDPPARARPRCCAHVVLDDPAAGPLPRSPTSSTPSSFASCRTAGVALTAAVGSAGTTATMGSLAASPRCSSGSTARRRLLALFPDHDEDRPDRRDVAFCDEDLEHRSRPRRGDLDRRLVRLDLDERLILVDPVALLDEPARDLALGEAPPPDRAA
jgi:hypothetical protein